MTSPTDGHDQTDLDQARHELREGIENTRALLQQSRMLIELSESDCPASRGGDDYGVAN